jgi:uncharacterized protein YjiS (DUF1127 family)
MDGGGRPLAATGPSILTRSVITAWLYCNISHCSSGRQGITSASPNRRTWKMNIRQKIAQFAAYQRTVRELASLDNRQLNDLGIARSDIKAIARAHTL